MTRVELEIKLAELEIPKNCYDLYADKIGEQYVVLHKNEKWEVYYSERGNKNELKIFSAEKEACDYFYSWMLNKKKFHEKYNLTWN